MGLSQLSERCRKCQFVEECDHKRMEALMYLPEPQIAAGAGQPMAMDAARPMLRETITIHVEGKPTTIYKDEMEKQIYRKLYSSMSLLFGGDFNERRSID